ncbi:MAG: secondary thiamine-phosphate synthase enzyme YjbQ [Bacteroidota bacterium]|jgi:secondary thiamine-phosphate synthase enzyme
MEVITEHIKVSTKGNSEVIDITEKVTDLLRQLKLKEGNATIFVVGSTASITTIEFEPGLRKDIPEMLERIAPSDVRYHHDDTWGDGNGHAHVRASVLGPSLVVPFTSGVLLLGTWQQIVLIDFDNRARNRDIVIQFMGR